MGVPHNCRDWTITNGADSHLDKLRFEIILPHRLWKTSDYLTTYENLRVDLKIQELQRKRGRISKGQAVD